MNSPTPATEIQNAFRTLALQLGGIIHLHNVDDEAAWALARVVDSAFHKAVKSVSHTDGPPAPVGAHVKHPSIQHLLNSIGTN